MDKQSPKKIWPWLEIFLGAGAVFIVIGIVIIAAAMR
jgi:hypothetical protein